MFGKTRLTAVALGGAVALATVGAVGGVAYRRHKPHDHCVRAPQWWRPLPGTALRCSRWPAELE